MIKPDRMMCSKPGAEDIEALRNRQLWIEYLYELDGRHRKDHPRHGVYTGLAKAYALLPVHDC